MCPGYVHALGGRWVISRMRVASRSVRTRRRLRRVSRQSAGRCGTVRCGLKRRRSEEPQWEGWGVVLYARTDGRTDVCIYASICLSVYLSIQLPMNLCIYIIATNTPTQYQVDGAPHRVLQRHALARSYSPRGFLSSFFSFSLILHRSIPCPYVRM